MANLFNSVKEFAVVPYASELPVIDPFLAALAEQLILGGGVPGIDVVGLDVDNVSVAVSLFGATDTIVVNGEGVTDILTSIETDDFDTRNDTAEFAIFDLDVDGSFELTPGGRVIDGDNLDDLLANVIEGSRPRFEIDDIDNDNVVFRITRGGVTDTLLIDGAEDAIAAVTSDAINVGDDVNELAIFDVEESATLFVGNADLVSDEFAALADSDAADQPSGFGALFLNETEALAIAREVVVGDGVEGVELLNIDDDTATLTVAYGDAEDIVVLDNLDLVGATSDLEIA